MTLSRLSPLILAAVLLSGANAAAQTDTRVPDGTRYVASWEGRTYYWIGCSAWRSLKPADLRFFKDREAAIAAGLRASRSQGCDGPGGDTPTAAPGECVVSRIVDGDTFHCTSGEKIRLLLIDAPESGQGDAGLRAKLALEEMAPTGARVRLEYDAQSTDRYGRTLAHVHAGTVWVNRAMVRRGYALVTVYPPNVRHVETLRAAADSARTEGVGLWGRGGFGCSPVDFRAKRCR